MNEMIETKKVRMSTQLKEELKRIVRLLQTKKRKKIRQARLLGFDIKRLDERIKFHLDEIKKLENGT